MPGFGSGSRPRKALQRDGPCLLQGSSFFSFPFPFFLLFFLCFSFFSQFLKKHHLFLSPPSDSPRRRDERSLEGSWPRPRSPGTPLPSLLYFFTSNFFSFWFFFLFALLPQVFYSTLCVVMYGPIRNSFVREGS